MDSFSMKACATCQIVKPLSDFNKNKGMRDGYLINCKSCHKDKRNRRNRELTALGQANHQLLRQKALDILGGNCVRCGFSDYRALQIDHIDGGGCAERKQSDYYRRKVERRVVAGFTDDYQILCANCNWIKIHENNEWKPLSLAVSLGSEGFV